MQSSTNCKECQEKERKLFQMIEANKALPGALIPILHDAQDIYGYLPKHVLLIISQELGISLAEVYGVTSFYTQFSLNPKGKYQINVCMGTACYVKGSNEILDKFMTCLEIAVGQCTEDGLFSLDDCRCIGACGLAPVVTVNDDVYGKIKAEDVDGIIAKYESLG